jgi:hypothetical protein
MTPSVEMDHDPFGLDFHLAGGLDEGSSPNRVGRKSPRGLTLLHSR